MATALDRLDRQIAKAMRVVDEPVLRLALGLVFIWFGLLKPLGVSPAADLVARTVYWGVDPAWFIPFLGWWEVAIGICLIDPPALLGKPRVLTRIGILLLFLQMPGTFLPLVMLPDITWREPFVPTLEGQYIIKNLALIGGALYLGGRVRSDERIASAAPEGSTTDR